MEKLLCSILPKEYAEKNCVFPISIENGKLKVMMQSYDIGLMNELKLLCQKDIGVVLEDRFVIEKNIEEGYKGSNTGKDLHNKMVEEIIKNAIKISASDIHIEPFENFFKLRYRINGDLKDIDKYSLDDLNPIVSIIKLKANCDIGEKRLSQDGRFTYQYNNTKVDCRLSIIPTINGEKLVIRLLNHSEFLKSRNELGFSKKAIKYIDQIINQKHGILIVSGATGSGKTSTIYSIINELKKNDINITTIEDPVEYKIDGVNQIQVNEKINMTFDVGLRSVLRQDPDTIMVGEIRDKKTAETAIRAAITGHFVITSLHTNDAVSSINRLLDMGIERYMINASLKGIISQKLIKKKIIYDNYLKDDRCLIYEILKIDKEIKEAIISEKTESQLKDLAIENGMITYEESIKEKN